MNDVQQLLIWENRRKAVEWWIRLSESEKASVCPSWHNMRTLKWEDFKDNTNSMVKEIEILYKNRE